MSAAGPKKYKVLFLCTGNSARSILAEYFLRRVGGGRFEAYSAGANPRGRVNPLVLSLLDEAYQIDASGARSKSWQELSGVAFDFVITVCDRARESCPVWPGRPITAHWSSEDPDAAENEAEQERVIRRVAREIHRRVELFCALPLETLDRMRAEEMTRGIGTR